MPALWWGKFFWRISSHRKISWLKLFHSKEFFLVFRSNNLIREWKTKAAVETAGETVHQKIPFLSLP